MHPEAHHEEERIREESQLLGVLIQIAILDIVFSLDSVITAVGMANHLPVMILADYACSWCHDVCSETNW